MLYITTIVIISSFSEHSSQGSRETLARATTARSPTQNSQVHERGAARTSFIATVSVAQQREWGRRGLAGMRARFDARAARGRATQPRRVPASRAWRTSRAAQLGSTSCPRADGPFFLVKATRSVAR